MCTKAHVYFITNLPTFTWSTKSLMDSLEVSSENYAYSESKI